MFDYGSPENRRINTRQAVHRIVWSSDPWKWKRIVFLTHPSNKGGCVWCGNIANVVEHDDWDAYLHGEEHYLDFFKCGAVPMCSLCNQAKRRGKILCPRCKRQGHYVHSPDEICWSCKTPEERDRILFLKDQKRRNTNLRNQKLYRAYHPKKVIRNGVWVTISRKPS